MLSRNSHISRDSEEYHKLVFNKLDLINKCDRRSEHGEYKLEINTTFKVATPLNPVGRTGIIGRGHLGHWGPNHAADPIVTR